MGDIIYEVAGDLATQAFPSQCVANRSSSIVCGFKDTATDVVSRHVCGSKYPICMYARNPTGVRLV